MKPPSLLPFQWSFFGWTWVSRFSLRLVLPHV